MWRREMGFADDRQVVDCLPFHSLTALRSIPFHFIPFQPVPFHSIPLELYIIRTSPTTARKDTAARRTAVDRPNAGRGGGAARRRRARRPRAVVTPAAHWNRAVNHWAGMGGENQRVHSTTRARRPRAAHRPDTHDRGTDGERAGAASERARASQPLRGTHRNSSPNSPRRCRVNRDIKGGRSSLSRARQTPPPLRESIVFLRPSSRTLIGWRNLFDEVALICQSLVHSVLEDSSSHFRCSIGNR